MLKSLKLRLAAAAFLTTGLLAPAHAQSDFNFEGWWLVLANFKTPDEGTSANQAAIEKVYMKAKECGYEAFNDFSMKFDGFKPGFDSVVVWSAFSSKAEAEAAQAKIRACIPDAYIKQARYAGE